MHRARDQGLRAPHSEADSRSYQNVRGRNPRSIFMIDDPSRLIDATMPVPSSPLGRLHLCGPVEEDAERSSAMGTLRRHHRVATAPADLKQPTALATLTRALNLTKKKESPNNFLIGNKPHTQSPTRETGPYRKALPTRGAHQRPKDELVQRAPQAPNRLTQLRLYHEALCGTSLSNGAQMKCGVVRESNKTAIPSPIGYERPATTRCAFSDSGTPAR